MTCSPRCSFLSAAFNQMGMLQPNGHFYASQLLKLQTHRCHIAVTPFQSRFPSSAEMRSTWTGPKKSKLIIHCIFTLRNVMYCNYRTCPLNTDQSHVPFRYCIQTDTQAPIIQPPFTLCVFMTSTVEQLPLSFSSPVPFFFNFPLSHPPYVPPVSIVHVCSSFPRVNSISSHPPAVPQASHPPQTPHRRQHEANQITSPYCVCSVNSVTGIC